MARCNSKIREVIGYRAMKGFYYICDFLNTAVQIWFVLQLANGLFDAKVTGKRLYIGQAAVIGMVAFFKCTNDVLYKVLFSNGMLVLMALLVAIGGKLLYESRYIDAFCYNIWGFTLLALIDFFVQTAVYQVLKEQGRQTDILLSSSTERGCYLLVFAVLLIPVGIKAGSWLARWRGTVFQYRRQGGLLLIPMFICMVYFQNIYLFYDSEQLLGSWRLFVQGGALFCILFWIYRVKNRTDEENRILQMKVEMLESNYLALRQVNDEKERLLQDMKNHMYTFREIHSRGGMAEALMNLTGRLSAGIGGTAVTGRRRVIWKCLQITAASL